MTRPPTVRLIHADEAIEPDPQALYPAEPDEVRVNPAPRTRWSGAAEWAIMGALLVSGVFVGATCGREVVVSIVDLIIGAFA